MGLFEPIWKTRMFHTDKEKKAIAYVRNLSDPEKLAVIALEAPSLNVRRAAVEGIVDEKLLLDVALKTDSCFVAEAVTEKLHDSGLLQELALHGTDSIPFEKLVKKVPDDVVLAKIGHCAASVKAQEAAVRELQNPSLLLDFVSSKDPAIRHAAQERFLTLRDGNRNRMMGEKGAVSREQFSIYIDALIAEEDINYPLSLPADMGCEELSRIYKNAFRTDLRAKAFARLVCCCPADDLVKLYKTECIKTKRADDAALPYWREASLNLVNRIMCEEKRNVTLLRRFIEDPDAGYEIGARRIGLLFAEELDNTTDIEQIRSSSIGTYLGNIPHWADKCQYLSADRVEKAAIWTLGTTLREPVRKQFGFEVETRDFTGEDQFGRYTSGCTKVRYKGKTY